MSSTFENHLTFVVELPIVILRDCDIVAGMKDLADAKKIISENYLSDKLGKKVDLVGKDGLKKYIKKDILDSTVYV